MALRKGELGPMILACWSNKFNPRADGLEAYCLPWNFTRIWGEWGVWSPSMRSESNNALLNVSIDKNITTGHQKVWSPATSCKGFATLFNFLGNH